MLKRFGWSVALVCLTRTASAADFYVSQAGAGTRSGASVANAWSLEQFNASTSPGGGDSVHFSGKFTNTVTPSSGGSGNGAKRLTLSFGDATLTADPGLSVVGQAYLNIEGGTIKAANATGISFGGQASHDVTVKDWMFNGKDDDTGLFISANYCTNLVVANNTVMSSGGFIFGDSTANHDLTIQNNWATTSRNVTDETDIIKFGDAFNVVIEGNKLVQRTTGDNASGRHNDCIQTYQKGGSNPGNPHGWTIRYNWIELDVQNGTGDSSWLMLEDMANQNGLDACKIYGNVFFGAPTDTGSNNGIAPNSNDKSAVFRFYNNTVIRKNGPDNTIRFLAPGTLYADNNAGYAEAGASGTFISWLMDPGAPWDHNWFYRFNASDTETGPHGGTSDPKFTDVDGNDFSLQMSSPLTGSGDSSIGDEYAMGIVPHAIWPGPALVARPTSDWDVGAYQHCSGPCAAGDGGVGGGIGGSMASASGAGGAGHGGQNGPGNGGADGGDAGRSESSSGCGCTVVGDGFTSAAALPSLALLALVRLRRRQRASFTVSRSSKGRNGGNSCRARA